MNSRFNRQKRYRACSSACVPASSSRTLSNFAANSALHRSAWPGSRTLLAQLVGSPQASLPTSSVEGRCRLSWGAHYRACAHRVTERESHRLSTIEPSRPYFNLDRPFTLTAHRFVPTNSSTPLSAAQSAAQPSTSERFRPAASIFLTLKMGRITVGVIFFVIVGGAGTFFTSVAGRLAGTGSPAL